MSTVLCFLRATEVDGEVCVGTSLSTAGVSTSIAFVDAIFCPVELVKIKGCLHSGLPSSFAHSPEGASLRRIQVVGHE